MITLITLCLCGIGCTALAMEDTWTPEELEFEHSLDDYVPARPKHHGVISPRNHLGYLFSRPKLSHQMELGASKRRSGQVKRQQHSETQSCPLYTFMCRKSHHPLCNVTHRSETADSCVTKIICDQNATNQYSESAVCYAADKAFVIPEQIDLSVYSRVMFSYNVKLIGENNEELPYRLRGTNTSNVAPGHVSTFIDDYKRRINITQFIIRSRYNCRDVSMCTLSDSPSASLPA